MKKDKMSSSNEVTKRMNRLAYMLIAFHQGVSYISQLAIQYFFKDELKIEPSRLAQINSIVHIPWAIKPFLGLLTDLLPIFGYRRKVYIILCGVFNLLAWLYMSFYTNTATMACVMIFIINFTLSFCSVLGEAVVVELSQLETNDKDSKAKDYVSLFFFSRTIGELLSAYLKGLFVDIMPLRTIFFIGSFIPIMLVIAGFMLIEKKVSKEQSVSAGEQNVELQNQERRENYGSIESNDQNNNRKEDDKNAMKRLFTFLCQKSILIPLIFIIVFKATPSYYDSFFYFITNELKLTVSDLGKISFCSTIAILLAIMIYRAYLKGCNFKIMIIIGTFISFFISLACLLLVLRINIKLGIPDFWLLLFTNSFLSMVAEFVLLPILSLACVLCPKNLEGTVYAVFMSSLNFGGILSHLNGGILTGALNITTKDYTNLPWLIFIAKIFSLLPLPMLLFIDDKYFHPENKEHEAKPLMQSNEVEKKEEIKEEVKEVQIQIDEKKVEGDEEKDLLKEKK